MAVAVLALQAPPGRPEHRRDHRKEGCCEQCAAQACSSDSTSSQGESSLIRSTWCCLIVCTSMYKYVQVYTRMYEYVLVYTSMYEYVRVCTSHCMYQYNQGLQIFMICTNFFFTFCSKIQRAVLRRCISAFINNRK